MIDNGRGFRRAGRLRATAAGPATWRRGPRESGSRRTPRRAAIKPLLIADVTIVGSLGAGRWRASKAVRAVPARLAFLHGAGRLDMDA